MKKLRKILGTLMVLSVFVGVGVVFFYLGHSIKEILISYGIAIGMCLFVIVGTFLAMSDD